MRGRVRKSRFSVGLGLTAFLLAFTQSGFWKPLFYWLLSDGELIWGYRFVDSNQEKLQRLAKHLESLGYTFVKISEAKNKEDLGEFELQVEKIERHSPATLIKRNEEFRTLAMTFGIRKYNQGSIRRVK